jgi:hypothetical protein
MTVESGAQGGMIVKARSKSLSFEKRVTRDGAFRMELVAGADRVTVDVGQRAITVRRGDSTVSFDAASPNPTSPAGLARLLSGSAAIKALTRLSDALLEADRRSPAATAVMVSRFWIDGLQGRGERLSAWRASMPGRDATPAVRLTAGGGESCFSDYADDLMAAFDEYQFCQILSGLWNAEMFIGMDLCDLWWLLQIESALLEFFGCLRIPIIKL